MATRSNDKSFLILCESPGPEYLTLKGLKLPTNQQIILCFLANLHALRQDDTKRQEPLRVLAATKVTEQILLVYSKADIPVLSERRIRAKIFELHDEYLSLKKSAGRKIKRTSAFFETLPRTAVFWPKRALEIMEANKKGKNKAEVDAIEEDMKFLVKMQGDRSASFRCKDTITPKLKHRRITRKEKELKRNEKAKGEMKNSFVFEAVDTNIESNQEPFIDATENVPVKRQHRRTIKTSCNISIPHDILEDPDIVSLYTRHNVSHTFMSAMLFTIIEKCGGDPNAICLSPSSTLR